MIIGWASFCGITLPTDGVWEKEVYIPNVAHFTGQHDQPILHVPYKEVYFMVMQNLGLLFARLQA